MEQIKLLKSKIEKEIQDIDNKSIYSISYYFNNDEAKRERLVSQLKDIELEIMYIMDDEKRAKYKPIRSLDPLKNKIN
jgi:hypothetical protein